MPQHRRKQRKPFAEEKKSVRMTSWGAGLPNANQLRLYHSISPTLSFSFAEEQRERGIEREKDRHRKQHEVKKFYTRAACWRALQICSYRLGRVFRTSELSTLGRPSLGGVLQTVLLRSGVPFWCCFCFCSYCYDFIRFLRNFYIACPFSLSFSFSLSLSLSLCLFLFL